MDEPALFLITGAMAAGKSTVAQALAERFAKSVHLRGDQFRRAVVNGREDMSAEPSAEAMTQLRLRYRLAANAADTYVEAGFTTVVQDVVIGPMLDEFVALVSHRPLHVVMLMPTAAELGRREAARPKTGYGAITPEHLDRVVRNDTPRIGLWLDSTGMTVERTVDTILEQAVASTIG